MKEKRGDLLIPVSIFNRKLGSLESIVKYIKEIGLCYSEIAVLLNRDQRTIWNVYKKANEKHPIGFELEKSVISIPSSVLKNRKLSVLEALSVFLREKENLSLNEISMVLNRSNKTIWTAYNRAKQKS